MPTCIHAHMRTYIPSHNTHYTHPTPTTHYTHTHTPYTHYTHPTPTTHTPTTHYTHTHAKIVLSFGLGDLYAQRGSDHNIGGLLAQRALGSCLQPSASTPCVKLMLTRETSHNISVHIRLETDGAHFTRGLPGAVCDGGGCAGENGRQRRGEWGVGVVGVRKETAVGIFHCD